MPFQWSDFLDIAKFLRNSGKTSSLPPDAAYRCAISRAYYAAFCHSRDYAEKSLGFIPTKNPKDHGKLRIHLSKNNMGSIATTLDRLRQWRNDSDYENPSPTLSEPNANTAITDAEKIIQSL